MEDVQILNIQSNDQQQPQNMQDVLILNIQPNIHDMLHEIINRDVEKPENHKELEQASKRLLESYGDVNSRLRGWSSEY